MAQLQASDVWAGYGGSPVLAGVSLDLTPGDAVGLIGRSGVGKSTLVEILAGTLEPGRGSVTFDGRRLAKPSRRDRKQLRARVRVVHQNGHDAADSAVTVERAVKGALDEARAAGRSTGMGVAEAIGGWELPPQLLRRRVGSLSGGERQRLALALATATRPEVLLLDEPLTALDAALRERLRGELNGLLRTLGITAIYVTHDQAEAMELGDRIVVMRKGAIAQVGTPREIYFTPADRFVAEFVGAANIIEAPIESGDLILPGGRQPVGSTRAKAVAMVRPETIAIVDADKASLTGVVDSIRFAGDRQRIIVRDAAAIPLALDVPHTIHVRAGERIGLSIAADSIRLLPAEG